MQPSDLAPSGMTDALLARVREQILAAAADGIALAPTGGSTKAFYGNVVRRGAAPVQTLELGQLQGIRSYEPSELVLVARAGTPLVELEDALAQKGQMLGFEPPHFGSGATIGGCVAAGLAGPRRMAAGAVRDFVLGAECFDGRARLLRFGGQVMKNVAGYDVARLMAGSLGTLGVITEVSLKVVPAPAALATLALPMAQADALLAFDRWAALPLPISAAAWVDGLAWVRLAGARAALDAALTHLGRGQKPETPELAEVFWNSLREQTHPFFTPIFAPIQPASAAASPLQPAGPERLNLWRLALPARVAPLALPGATDTLIEWGGAQRWIHSNAPASQIRAAVSAAGGHATRFRCFNGADEPVFSPLPAPLLAIERRLQGALDPAGIFNPGRLHPST